LQNVSSGLILHLLAANEPQRLATTAGLSAKKYFTPAERTCRCRISKISWPEITGEILLQHRPFSVLICYSSCFFTLYSQRT
jgi:hypothetical protein